MDHNDIRHMLSEYIDGSLTAEEQAAAGEHLKTCPDCSSALGELRKTVEHIRNLEEAEPPAWMTQKIMARVREEEDQKKPGLLRRIFFPLHIKLPLETIGVLFIAVTVYFVARDVQQTKPLFPEAPVQTYSQEPAPADTGAPSGPNGSLLRKRALDRKPAREKPESFAPAPEPLRRSGEKKALKSEPSLRRRPAEQSASEFPEFRERTESLSDRAAPPRAPAAAMAENNAAAGFAVEEEGAETAAAGMSGRKMLTLVVSDVDRAASRVEDAVREYGGKMLRKEQADGALSLTVAMDPASNDRLIERLKTFGAVKGVHTAEVHREGTILRIRIVKQVQQN